MASLIILYALPPTISIGFGVGTFFHYYMQASLGWPILITIPVCWVVLKCELLPSMSFGGSGSDLKFFCALALLAMVIGFPIGLLGAWALFDVGPIVWAGAMRFLGQQLQKHAQS